MSGVEAARSSIDNSKQLDSVVVQYRFPDATNLVHCPQAHRRHRCSTDSQSRPIHSRWILHHLKVAMWRPFSDLWEPLFWACRLCNHCLKNQLRDSGSERNSAVSRMSTVLKKRHQLLRPPIGVRTIACQLYFDPTNTYYHYESKFTITIY